MTDPQIVWRGNRGFLGQHAVFILDHETRYREGRDWFVYSKLPGNDVTDTAESRAAARALAERALDDWLRDTGLDGRDR